METIICGKAWVGGDNISTYDIIPANRWTMEKLDPEELGKWALEDADPAFSNKANALKDTGSAIVVAGIGFGGGGKSIEHPIFALKGAGIKIVIADSFARYNFRNSVNNGFPVVTCEGINKIVKNGDELEIDLVKGTVENKTTGVSREIVPMSDFVLSMLEAGGLIAYTKKQLASNQ